MRVREYLKTKQKNIRGRVDEEAHSRSLISAAQTADEAELPISQHFSSDDFSILQIWPEHMT